MPTTSIRFLLRRWQRAGAAVLFVYAGLAATAQAESVTATFRGFGLYNQVEGSQDPSNGIYPGLGVYFSGQLTYDTTWADVDPNPRHGDYRPPADAITAFALSWTDGYTCSQVCPIGFAPGSFVMLDGPQHRHSLGFQATPISIRDALPGSGMVDVWGQPFAISGTRSDLLEGSLEWALLDIYGAGAATHLSSDALGVAPNLAEFGGGSFIVVGRREHICAASTYAEAAAAGDSSSIAAYTYCATTLTSSVHWQGQFSEFTASAATVPEPAPMALCVVGLLGLAWQARRARFGVELEP